MSELVVGGLGLAALALIYFAGRRGGKASERAKQLQDNEDARKRQDAVPDMSDDDADDWLRGKR